jgi:hypothetical protein
MATMTMRGKVDFAGCGITNLYASICISQCQALPIGRPGNGKDAGNALRGF